MSGQMDADMSYNNHQYSSGYRGRGRGGTYSSSGTGGPPEYNDAFMTRGSSNPRGGRGSSGRGYHHHQHQHQNYGQKNRGGYRGSRGTPFRGGMSSSYDN